MMKMDPENKNSKVKHFQLIEKKINGENTNRNKQRRKKTVKVVQIMKKGVIHVIQVII